MRTIIVLLELLLAFFCVHSQPIEVPLWPDGTLDLEGIENNETVVNRSKTSVDRSFRNVHIPTLTIYLPTEDVATGTAVVICPGGGYRSLAIDKEGHDIARWLNTIGVAAMVLKYRLPRPEGHVYGAEVPLKDAKQALKLVRIRAVEFDLDPQKIGMMGFSAGGHLVASAGTLFDSTNKDYKGNISTVSDRPDFLILGYPVTSFEMTESGSRTALLGENPSQELITRFSAEKQVTTQTPPTFIVHAWDDPVDVRYSLLFATALKEAGVSAELHLYQSGGHGFGIRKRGDNVHTWTERCQGWAKKAFLPDKDFWVNFSPASP